jgi:FSR family fosmidomycin resistance protein-like MFS transporter
MPVDSNNRPPIATTKLSQYVNRPSSLILIILLVSAAHAMVHLLEQSIASVEMVICSDFGLDLRESGWLGLALRLPYGLGAIFAGLLADRYGEKRILVFYLLAAALTCFGFSAATDANLVYILLFGLGTCASMYHPAGLALLANSTTPATRARALGIHGVFGSLGIASAPFLAGLVLTLSEGAWKEYYLLLGLASAGLGVVIYQRLHPPPKQASSIPTQSASDDPHQFQWVPYLLLVSSAAISGLIYGGVLHFLPRYLEESGTLRGISGGSEASAGNFAAAIALACGAAGQWTAGRVAIARWLPVQLSVIYASNAPLLIWMTYADGTSRLVAAGIWAFFHFMNQPLYNALVAEFMSVGRRSFGFGFSNMMGFGVGAVGPSLIARYDTQLHDYTHGYLVLAGIAVAAAIIPLAVASSGIATRETETTT